MNSDAENLKAFNTLRGFVNGSEPDEEIYFYFSATLRIHGIGIPFDQISTQLGIEPTHQHRKGDSFGPRSAIRRDDAWHYQIPIPKTAPLDEHLYALWEVLKDHVDYLKSLKGNFKVDVFCGYRSNCDHAGFEVSHESLELFQQLEIPFGVSIIV